MTVADRAAIVTGGAGALGQAVSLRLLADGAHVWVPYVVEAERARLVTRVPAAQASRLSLVPADVTDGAAMTGLADAVLARHGRVDVLVAGVGGFAGGPLVETDRDTWDRMLAMNLTSMHRWSRTRRCASGSRTVKAPPSTCWSSVISSGRIASPGRSSAMPRTHAISPRKPSSVSTGPRGASRAGRGSRRGSTGSCSTSAWTTGAATAGGAGSWPSPGPSRSPRWWTGTRRPTRATGWTASAGWPGCGAPWTISRPSSGRLRQYPVLEQLDLYENLEVIRRLDELAPTRGG